MSGNEAWLKQCAEWLEFSDLAARAPVSPPKVTLFESKSFTTRDKYDHWTPGYMQSRETVQSMLIQPEDFDLCKKFGLHDVRAADNPFLVEADGISHIPAGVQTHMGVEIESIYFDHFWDGLDGKSLLIPSQHLILYLGLEQDQNDHAVRTTWSDPLDVREIIERTGQQDTHSDRSLRIQLDYLRDYLAARKKCLIVLRWAERFVTYGLSDDFPWTQRDDEQTAAGHIVFEGPHDIGGRGFQTLRASLWEWYRVDPAPKPRHYMLDDQAECHGAADFMDAAENPIRFESHKDFMRVISLRRDVLSLFNTPSRLRWTATNISPGQLALCFPRGNALWASDSPHGQIQVLFGDLAKLDEEYQRVLAPFSEMQQGKPHEEWFEAGFMCNPTENLAWHERLQRAQLWAHRALAILTQRNPIRAMTMVSLSEKILRPSPEDEEALFQISKVLRRALLNEGRTCDWFLEEVLNAIKDKDGVGSIGAIKAFMRTHNSEKLDDVAKPLDALNRFRQVDAHSVEATKVLLEMGYDSGDYATRFDRLMESVSVALEILAATAIEVAKNLGLSVSEEAGPTSESGVE